MSDGPRQLRIIVLLFLAVTMASCGLFEPAAAHQLDLSGTSWTVESVDGGLADSAQALDVTFDTGDRVRVSTGCGDYTAEFAWDTDGSALSFGEFEHEPLACDPSFLEAVSGIVEALEDTEAWRVVSQSAIELRGVRVIRLERPDPAG